MKLNNETKIGIMVVVVFVILALFTVGAGNFNLARGGYNLKVQFNDINGVNLNSPVMFNGLEVGVVEDIAIKDVDNQTRIELTLWVNDKAMVREGSKAYVKNLGLMGEKFIGLTSGDVQGGVLPSGSLIIGEDPPSFDELVSKGHGIAVEMEGITKNLNERLELNKENIDKILAQLNSLTGHLSSLTQSVDERLQNNDEHIDQIIANLNETSVNIKELTQDLKINPWKLLHK